MNLREMSVDQLIDLKDEILKLIPDVSSLDLSKELTSTYLQLKELLSDIVDDPRDTKPQQIATLVGSINSSLKQLADYQKNLYGVQRQRAVEQALFETFESEDQEVKERFIKNLEEKLEGL